MGPARTTAAKPRAWNRRSFLELGGGSAALAFWLRSAIARAEGAAGPKRLVIVHRPNGSVAGDFAADDQPGPILKALGDAWAWAVAVRGVNVVPSNGLSGGSHQQGQLTLMTGGKLGTPVRNADDYQSTAESVDQTLARKSPVLGGTLIPSLQLGAESLVENEISSLVLSYAGPAQPLYPVVKPADVYQRVFGNFVMPAGGDARAEALVKARARRRSVLDFVSWDLARVRQRFPASFKGELDGHEGAIRELEKALDTQGDPSGTCARPAAVDGALKGERDYRVIERVGLVQLKLLTAALQCDLTRTATFLWAAGRSSASFGGLGSDNHHGTTHDESHDVRPVLSAIERWYAEKTAVFIRDLAATADVNGGRLIDNTLVFYLNELADGPSHSFGDYPFVFFGGDGVGLRTRGRVLNTRSQGSKTANDLWGAVAPIFGTTVGPFPTAASSPVTGLFAT